MIIRLTLSAQDQPPATYKLVEYSPAACFLLDLCSPAGGLITLSGHSADPLPRAELLMAHATFARIWDALGMEHEFQIFLEIKSQHQLEPDGSTEIPGHSNICVIF